MGATSNHVRGMHVLPVKDGTAVVLCVQNAEKKFSIYNMVIADKTAAKDLVDYIRANRDGQSINISFNGNIFSFNEKSVECVHTVQY